MCSCNNEESCNCDEAYEMNEIKYYLNFTLETMKPIEGREDLKPFVPQYIITAVKLPTGAIELAINDKNIEDKIKYILEAYDEDMKLKANLEIEMQNIMIV